MIAPTFEDILAARERISDHIHHTPLIPSFALSRMLDADVRLKLECFQDTRAFKVRGAANAVLTRQETDRPPRHVVTFSTGNHGRATAYVARKFGVNSTVCVSEKTPSDKRAALAEVSADVEVVGQSQDEARLFAVKLAGDGMTLIDPINDLSVTAGHGTIGLELAEDWPEVDTIVVPVSGGALASGIAIALCRLKPRVRIVAVSMDRGAAMFESLKVGHPIQVDEVESLADCLQGGIGLDNTHTFAIVRDMIDEFVLVTEDQIAMAMTEALFEENLILEGAGASPIAALIFARRELFGDRIALVATGGNVSADKVVSIGGEYRSALTELVAA